MKIFAILFCLCCSGYAFSQRGNGSVNAVKERMRLQEEAWNTGDIKEFMASYWNSDSLKFIGSKGITYGWQKTLDNYQKSYPTKEAMGKLTFQVLECIPLSDEAIYVVGKWNLEKAKTTGGHFTLLWRKVKDKWVIVSDHTS